MQHNKNPNQGMGGYMQQQPGQGQAMMSGQQPSAEFYGQQQASQQAMYGSGGGPHGMMPQQLQQQQQQQHPGMVQQQGARPGMNTAGPYAGYPQQTAGGAAVQHQQYMNPAQSATAQPSHSGFNTASSHSQSQSSLHSAQAGVAGPSTVYGQSTASHPPQPINIHKTEARRQLNPPEYPPDTLDNLDRYSVGALTVIGKELIYELANRTSTLCMGLKTVTEKKAAGSTDPEILLPYIQRIFEKLTEIRIRIEKQMPQTSYTTEEFLKYCSDPAPPVDDRPQELKDTLKKFNENRDKLMLVNNDLKHLDWMAAVSDPGLLKRVDKMAASSFTEG